MVDGFDNQYIQRPVTATSIERERATFDTTRMVVDSMRNIRPEQIVSWNVENSWDSVPRVTVTYYCQDFSGRSQDNSLRQRRMWEEAIQQWNTMPSPNIIPPDVLEVPDEEDDRLKRLGVK